MLADKENRRRILNWSELLSHGDLQMREAVLQILEAGLEASDPYFNAKQLMRVTDGKLVVGKPEYEPDGSPKTGEVVFDLSEAGRIFVFGAGKGIQRVAKAFEEVLGDRLTGGHVIDKKGHPVILERIGVTLGSHPVPDEDCVRGCRRIREIAAGLHDNDIVFTCVGNGVSALLTMPVPGVTIDDVRATTYLMQVNRGAGTGDLNMIRNNIDMMKSGRISRLFKNCRTVHVLAIEPGSYDQLMHRNAWLHTLPDNISSYGRAWESLKKWDALDVVPHSVRHFLEAGNPEFEPVRSDEFESTPCRIFGIMPVHRATGKFPSAVAKAKESGFNTIILAEEAMGVDASQAGKFVAAIARTAGRTGQPCKPPCVILSGGEMTVAVGKEHGIGGRNQEFCVSAALGISGTRNIVVGSVDTDGTDGPGVQFSDELQGMPNCLAGGIVDGYTAQEAAQAGISLTEELKRHNTSVPLWHLKNGVVASPSISLNDLTVALVLPDNK